MGLFLKYMDNSFKYFKNVNCKYMPCHEDVGDEFNCLFCYCPLNRYEDCLGTPEYKTMENGTRVKICTNCIFPHIPENYEKIIEFIKNKTKN